MIQENLYTKDCIRTFTGIYFNIINPTEDMICIEDIAHSLSMQCRFAGHLPVYYSVAEHSIRCHEVSSPENKLAALLHDASEAYLLDIPSPIKPHLNNYKEIENKIMKLVAKKFGFLYPLVQEVRDIDKYMLEWEWNNIMLNKEYSLNNNILNVKKLFIDTFNKL